jgi:hypothetical protein
MTHKHIVVLDFESYYDKDYSLAKMTTAEYVLDARFEAIGFGISFDGVKPRWWSGDRAYLSEALAKYPIEDSMVVAHNAIFDGSVLEWIFNRKPASYFCTMMASRPHVVPFTHSMSLGAVAKFHGLGAKGTAAIKNIGKHRTNFTAAQLAEYGEYCCDDVAKSLGILGKEFQRLPEDERYLLDLTIKKFTRPKLQLDTQVLQARYDQIVNAKTKTLLTLPKGVGKSHLTSNDQFAVVLKNLGVDPPRKVSPTTGHMTFAFSKADEEFTDLLGHEDFRVRHAVQARLAWKSNMEENRIKRLQCIAGMTEEQLLPVPLLYYGAHPGRFSGIDSINLQNLPRPKKGIIGIRHALVAPPGYKIVAADLSQIEARIVAAIARAKTLLEAFADPARDPYGEFGTRVYKYPVNKKDTPVERFVSKGCVLGLQYYVGAKKLLAVLRAQAVAQGINLTINLADTTRFVEIYRTTNWEIPELWKELGKVVLAKMMRPGEPPMKWKMLEIHHQKLILPNGMPIYYNQLQSFGNRDVGYKIGNKKDGEPVWQHLHPGVLLENITQALARIVISRAEIRLARAGLTAVLQAHDELVYVVKDEHVTRVVRALELALTDPVPWLPTLPLACEVGVGTSYGQVK